LSKHDFSPEEFASRCSRVRAVMSQAGLDWLLVFHPVSIHWLTGSDAKSYQDPVPIDSAAPDRLAF
jgi:Xaa-Pro dipeptidase